MLPNPLTNFELQKYYQNEPKFNDIYSTNHLSKIRMRNIKYDYESIGTHWIDCFVCKC